MRPTAFTRGDDRWQISYFAPGGREVAQVVIEDAKHVSEHEGRTYYFCGKGCKLEFEDDPGRILAADYEPHM